MKQYDMVFAQESNASDSNYNNCYSQYTDNVKEAREKAEKDYHVPLDDLINMLFGVGIGVIGTGIVGAKLINKAFKIGAKK